ncbi:sensor histidine kinase [Streptomyces sp. SBT349]|uniref:sensor histidine kinase n=1 Tax=Streptomyces sp. SBT349 TaxID=1580539 RepID=UPI00069D377E|nr:histidine kinase [Streptomyces sp. SBT349]
MRSSGWLGRLRGGSQRRRVHQYFRYSLDFIGAVELVTVVGLLASRATTGGWALAPVAAIAVARSLLGVRMTRAGLRHYLGEAPLPDGLLPAFCVLSLLALAAPSVAIAAGGLTEEALPVLAYSAAYFQGPVLLALPLGRGVGLGAVGVAAVAVGVYASGAPSGAQLWTLLATVLTMFLIGLTYRSSAWTLRVVDRMDAARETEGRLAVAEERLRFGRDLHDILGRNLSVIALKSELAAQLTVRDPVAAAAQMTEVEEIARESQREIREVVRGYRAVDLHAELAGARGVLEAAGIRCRIEHMDGRPAAADGGDGSGLPEPVQSTLGWVVREGTTNVLRHADAARCTVRVRRTASGDAVLDMENDGLRQGSSGVGDGTGLAGLRERLAALGGSLSAEPAEGGTFRLTARVPAGGGG